MPKQSGIAQNQQKKHNTRKSCEIGQKLNIQTSERHH